MLNAENPAQLISEVEARIVMEREDPFIQHQQEILSKLFDKYRDNSTILNIMSYALLVEMTLASPDEAYEAGKRYFQANWKKNRFTLGFIKEAENKPLWFHTLSIVEECMAFLRQVSDDEGLLQEFVDGFRRDSGMAKCLMIFETVCRMQRADCEEKGRGRRHSNRKARKGTRELHNGRHWNGQRSRLSGPRRNSQRDT